MADIKRNIKYLNKDFNSFKKSLIEYTKSYFPDTFNDFSENSTGVLFMEMTSYVGDVLSFYLDNQIQETFIQSARQVENLYSLSYMLGYTPKTTSAATTNIDFFQQIPAKTVNGDIVPDFNYSLKIPENTPISSDNGEDTNFIIEDPIDFSFSSSFDPTEITVYQIQGDEPTFFLLKKTRKAISATIETTSFNFTTPKKFDTRIINDNNIIGILDVFDTDGNEWYEVPNLAQDTIFDTIKNDNVNNPNYTDNDAPELLKLKKVQTRFASRFINRTNLELQFGAGSPGLNTEEIVPNPDNVGLGLPFEKNKLTTAFSPVNFMFTDTYGLPPSDTILNIRYLKGGGLGSNIEANALTIINTDNVTFVKPNLANTTLANTIFNSLAANNPEAASGGKSGDSIEEIRKNALGSFQNQLRTVTKKDYLIRALSMPSNLGVISKAYTTPTKVGDSIRPGELPTILDLFVLSYNNNKNLTVASPTIKRNLQTYLSEYRMINDSIKIKDAFIVNIGVEFKIVVLPNYNNNEVISRAIDGIAIYFNIDNWQINEPIILKDLFILLDKIEGVQTVKDVKISNIVGENIGYSNTAYDIEGATIDNVVYPSIDPMIFEVKNPSQDIKGRVVPL